MPVTPTYPGVYIEEIPSGVRTIVGVSTAVTAFIGYLRRGPMNEPVQLFSPADFERQFGGLDTQSLVSYAVLQFFRNGGAEAWVVRTAAPTPASAQITLDEDPGGTSVLDVAAANEGTWGNNLRLDVDRNTSDPASLFNLTVTLYQEVNGTMQPGTFEVFRNLSTDENSSNYGQDKINEDAKLIEVTAQITNGSALPASTGTVLDVSGLDPTTMAAADAADVNVSGATSISGSIIFSVAPTSLANLRNTLQSALRGIAGLEQATVELIQSSGGSVSRLRILVNGDDPAAILTFSMPGGSMVWQDVINIGQVVNAQQYLLGTAIAASAQSGQTSGNNGAPSTSTEIIGSLATREGIYALEDVNIFNILCIPDTSNSTLFPDPTSVLTDALAYCEQRRAFMIIDIPDNVNEVDEIRDWVNDNTGVLRNDHAAFYFPRVEIPDPLNDFRALLQPTSGTMAGLYARTDSERGVWKAPAGTEVVLRGVKALEYKLTDAENGALNPLGINCLRNFPVYGNISWGARTGRGADQLADEYKYIPIRRLALFLEESLYRGLQWAVFEPNDEPLWAQIRLNIGAFMHNLFRQGAFQGQKPSEAYFVKCDSETTTQNDRNLGIVNILVGFAPLKPAEFVILKIQQIAGQIET